MSSLTFSAVHINNVKLQQWTQNYNIKIIVKIIIPKLPFSRFIKILAFSMLLLIALLSNLNFSYKIVSMIYKIVKTLKVDVICNANSNLSNRNKKKQFSFLFFQFIAKHRMFLRQVRIESLNEKNRKQCCCQVSFSSVYNSVRVVYLFLVLHVKNNQSQNIKKNVLEHIQVFLTS